MQRGSMSWVYGCLYKISKHPPINELRVPSYKYHSQIIDLHLGGNPQTITLLQHPTKPQTSVFVIGNPILPVGEDFKYPSPSDWLAILQDENMLLSLDGHWLLIEASENSLIFRNDSLGKRSMYIHEDNDRFFFCSELPLLKQECALSINWDTLGAYWHGMFPPQLRRYAASNKSYYHNVTMMGTSAKVVLNQSQLVLSEQPWLPSSQAKNPETLLKNLCLLPLREGKRICLGITGGMDIRPLLAIYLEAKADIGTAHFGSNKTIDFQLAHQIASSYHLPFHYLSYKDAGYSWENILQYLESRGIGFNPISMDFIGYYSILAQDYDVLVDGYFGELFRFRFFVAHLKTALDPTELNYRHLGRYLYHDPSSFFCPEARRQMHKGFWNELRFQTSLMPPSQEMINPLWMNLFLVRNVPGSISMPNLSSLDTTLINHMPYLQSSLISEHWRYGFLRQLNEGLHRRIIRNCFPDLENHKLAIFDVSAPYNTHQYVLKLKTWAYHTKVPVQRNDRAHALLNDFKQQILELRHDSRVISDNAIDLPKLDYIISSYYKGDTALFGTMLGFLSYTLGK